MQHYLIQYISFSLFSPSLIAAQKREKNNEKPDLPETSLTDSQVQNEDAPINLQIPTSNHNGEEQEPPAEEIFPEVASIPDVEVKIKSNPSQSTEFWPSTNGPFDEDESQPPEDRPLESASIEKDEVDALFDRIDEKSTEASADQQQQRPIEDILQALDQLVSAPREVEISIDWDARGPINIREKTVTPSNASDVGSILSETDGLTEDRKRCIESLLKEVDECLRVREAEITAILHALYQVSNSPPENCIIYSDPLSALESMTSLHRFSHPLTSNVLELHDRLECRDSLFSFAGFPLT
ncbi:hypothetical protein AVEN_70211-1 [Araneus ventricosus]|uniref:Uncharacterized protein n=1 Tax=Araneus ventricosus TaxID=182803 RepID=A0A4Y2FFI9_ARAVE|nr:hypothetical protein AVEN_70211-1 [Araneus ventricosus]